MTLVLDDWTDEPPLTAEDMALARAEARRFFPHCGTCGRFISPKTLRVVTHAGTWETEEFGQCKVCGVGPTRYPA